ncbi:CCR4-NOT transcriptional complex subunit [Spathaspora sp. JA1]|nr:CCR4-NOT transcriptional complex subunit [Spathaspora sp. JA1]
MPFSLSPKQFLKHHRESSKSSKIEESDNHPVSPKNSQEYHGHVTSPGFSHPPSQLVNNQEVQTPKSAKHKIFTSSSPLAQPPTNSVDEEIEFENHPYPTTSATPSANSLASPVCYMNLNEIASFSSGSLKQQQAAASTSTTNSTPAIVLNSSSTSSAASSHKRTMSDQIKSSPASYVRSSRIFLPGENDGGSDILSSLSGKTLLLESKAQIELLPKEFHPILYLINAQKLRTYSSGSFEVSSGNNQWTEVDAKLTGNELTMWKGLSEVEQYKYINLIDFQIEVIGNLQIKLYQDFSENSNVNIRFVNQVEFNQWLSAIILCKFEYIKLNEAFTAVVLSSKASKLSDSHILMSKKRYPQSEYCNIRLPQVSTKWLKVYMVILPPDNKHLGRIEIYKDDKSTKQKNLVAFINSAKHVFNVYPEIPSMIDVNAIMNLKGEIYINKNFEYMFIHTGATNSPKQDSTSLFPPSSPKMTHSRSGSINSTSSSFFNSPGGNISPHPPSISGFSSRDRSSSNESKASSKLEIHTEEKEVSTKEHKRTGSSFLKKHANEFIMTDSIYIMPIAHPGVSPVETMIRNFIPIIDSFKLYGRPQMLISDRKDPECLLFGLPSLPRYQYLSRQQIGTALAQSLTTTTTVFDWEKIITDKIQKLQTTGYRGSGDISNLYNSLELIDSPPQPLAPGFQDDLPSLGDPISLTDVAERLLPNQVSV